MRQFLMVYRLHFLAGIIALIAMVWFAAMKYGAQVRSYDVPEADLPQAKVVVDDRTAVVIDVRSPDEFLAGHIPGALSIPIESLRLGDIPEELDKAKDRSIVVYCGKGLGRGPEGTHLLAQAGFARASNLKAGFSGWKDAGYPTESQQPPVPAQS
jgi:rhodanese-related sulfurtransferase